MPRRGNGKSLAYGPFAAFAFAHHEPFLAVDAEQPFVIDDKTLAPEEHEQAAITKTATLMRQSLQPLAQLRIVRPARTVTHRHPFAADHFARPPLAHLVIALQMRDSFPLHGGRYHFFVRRSFNAALSSIASARSFFSLPFSVSNSRRRRASETFMPPYLFFQL